MQRTIKTRAGRTVVLPTSEEDAAITAAAHDDPDAQPLSDEQWETVKPKLRRGRPRAEVTKERISIRLSREVLDAFRAGGPGWQTRMDEVLKAWVRSHL